MKKIIFGIFAHPDDEAFGPAGTLLKETKNGSELHLITLTAGGAGLNPDNLPDLPTARLEEWHQAGGLLGAKTMHFLGYQDGKLNNQDMVKVSRDIVNITTKIISESPEHSQIEFISFDFTGLSGHIDHIVATRAMCLAFYQLKQTDSTLSRIRLYCLPASLYPDHNIDWLYMESGRTDEEVDEIIDARDLQSDIKEVMRTHKTQRHDCDRYQAAQGDLLGLNHFIVKT